LITISCGADCELAQAEVGDPAVEGAVHDGGEQAFQGL
jgi:hypothetical protein